jgi:rhodanese-related sulfurtransferase
MSIWKTLFSTKESTMKNYAPQEVKALLDEGKIALIDVREPDEYAAERIAGSIPFPLSAFDPAKLPNTNGKVVVFHCAGGVRSARAVDACQKAGLAHDAHLAGGLSAWKSAGLPTVK